MHTTKVAGHDVPAVSPILSTPVLSTAVLGSVLAVTLLGLPGCDPDDDDGEDTAADTGGSDGHADHADHGHESGEHESGEHESGGHDSGDDESGDDESGDETGGEGIEIAGMWIETYRGGMVTHTIDDTMWVLDDAEFGATSYVLESFDNGARSAVGGDGMSFVKLQWTWTDDDTQLWYCTAAFGQETAEAAEAAPDADPSDPAMGGCGDFAWSMLGAG